MLDVHYPATRCYQYVCLCVRVYTIYVRVCVLHITIYYTCTSNFHLWHTSVFCSNIQKYQFFGTQNSLETNHPPDHQTTNIDCPPTMKKKRTPTVVARRLSCHCLARLPASLAVAAGGLRPGAGPAVPCLLGSRGGAGYRGQRPVATWLKTFGFGFLFKGFSSTYCRLVKLVQYGSCNCCNPMVLPVTVDWTAR